MQLGIQFVHNHCAAFLQCYHQNRQGCNHLLGSIRFRFKGKLIDFAIDRSLREQVLAILIIAITGQINTYIIQCMNQAFLSRLTLGHQHNVFCSGVCVALCNTGFKPILHFCNHRNIIIDCQKRKVRHLRIDIQIDARLTDARAQFNLLTVSLKNQARLLAAKSAPQQRLKNNFFLERNIILVLLLAYTEKHLKNRRLIYRVFIQHKGSHTAALLENHWLPILLQCMNRLHNKVNQAKECLKQICLTATIRAIDRADRKQIFRFLLPNQGILKLRNCHCTEIKCRFILIRLKILKRKLAKHSFNSFLLLVYLIFNFYSSILENFILI